MLVKGITGEYSFGLGSLNKDSQHLWCVDVGGGGTAQFNAENRTKFYYVT